MRAGELQFTNARLTIKYGRFMVCSIQFSLFNTLKCWLKLNQSSGSTMSIILITILYNAMQM